MLAAQNRLRKTKDIELIFQKGKKAFSQFFLVRYLPNQKPYSRFAVVVSNKVSKRAVQRNLLKRRVREILRASLSQLPVGLDLVVLVSPKIINSSKEILSFEKIKVNLLQTLNKIH